MTSFTPNAPLGSSRLLEQTLARLRFRPAGGEAG